MRRIYLAIAGLGMAIATGAANFFITPDNANGDEVVIPALSAMVARG